MDAFIRLICMYKLEGTINQSEQGQHFATRAKDEEQVLARSLGGSVDRVCCHGRRMVLRSRSN